MFRILVINANDPTPVLVLGTDSGTGGMGIPPGYSAHEELHILAEIGYSPFEAIKTGTVNAAMVVEKMNGKGNFGTIEKGKRADLILIKGNPLDDVANIKKILGVFNGKGVKIQRCLTQIYDRSGS